MQFEMNSKSIKNLTKSCFEWLEGRFGGVLDRVGRSKAFLGIFWSVLEASWRVLGRAGVYNGRYRWTDSLIDVV